MNDVMIEAEGLLKQYGPTEAVARHDVVSEVKAVRA
jgi:hypothetical protein